MKKSEIQKIVSEYKLLSTKRAKNSDAKIAEKMLRLKQRYYHETGIELTD